MPGLCQRNPKGAVAQVYKVCTTPVKVRFNCIAMEINCVVYR
jgi:hypothetical protein